jgi:hypothetical protein
MSLLMIELVNGQKEEFEFLGWKDDGLAFYATRTDGQAVVITPRSAYADNCNTGEPSRFPRMVPLKIVPKPFNLVWSDHDRDVLGRWREAMLDEASAESEQTLFPFDADKNPRPKRTPDEIDRRRQATKDRIESQYRELMETPIDELLPPIPSQYALDEFLRGRWADEMGKEFAVMMEEAREFSYRWHHAYDPSGTQMCPQGFIGALRGVRYVMRGDDNEVYHLAGVEVRRPTDREARAYAPLQRVMQGARAPRQRASEAAAGTTAQSEAKAGVGIHPFEQVRQELGCKPATLRSYCKILKINPDAIGVADFAQIKHHRENLKKRPHLKEWHEPHHGPKPKQKGKGGT